MSEKYEHDRKAEIIYHLKSGAIIVSCLELSNLFGLDALFTLQKQLNRPLQYQFALNKIILW